MTSERKLSIKCCINPVSAPVVFRAKSRRALMKVQSASTNNSPLNTILEAGRDYGEARARQAIPLLRRFQIRRRIYLSPEGCRNHRDRVSSHSSRFKRLAVDTCGGSHSARPIYAY
ncbi:MAG: hypothetical protein IJN29_05915 [Akkermansia sp.]|nr:hypothetical protein [Akkermansia sp.]